MKFEIAVADKQATQADRTYVLDEFTLPTADGRGEETYAAVRPVEGAFLMIMNIAARAQQKVEDQIVAVLQFLDVCFDERDIRAALLQSLEKDPKAYELLEPVDADVLRDEDLSDYGVRLVQSNKRIYGRLMDREDPLGPGTLAEVMKGLTEKWSGNPTGSPSDYLPPQKPTGTKSTGRRSSKASTLSRSTASPRRGSSRRSEPSSPEA